MRNKIKNEIYETIQLKIKIERIKSQNQSKNTI